MKRKFLSGLLALSMVLTLLPGTALAAGGTLTISAEEGSGLTPEKDGSYTISTSDAEQTVTLTLTKANVEVAEDTKATVTVAISGAQGEELAAEKVMAFGTGDTATATIAVPVNTAADTTYSVTAKVTPKAAEGSSDTPADVETTTPFTFTVVEAPAETYTVSGTVSAGDTGAEVKGIDVTLYKFEGDTRGDVVGTPVKTDNDGAFSFSDVAAGTYVAVVAAATGSYKEFVSDVITVATEAVTGVTITLVAEDAQKATLDSTAFTVTQDVVYDGTDHKATAVTIKDDANKGAKVTYTFKVDGTAKTEVKDAGIYAVTAAVEGNDSFEAVPEIDLGKFVIAPKELSFTAKNQTIAINGTVPTLGGADTYTINGLVAADETNAASIVTGVTMKYTNASGDATPDATAAGTYNIVITAATIAAGGNYKLAESNPYTAGTLTINGDGKVPATAITLNKTTATLAVGETVTLEATLTPNTSTDKVVFASSDTTVATVGADGTVTGVKAGTATITATIKDATAGQADVKAECTVTVEAADSGDVTATATAAGTVTGKAGVALAAADAAITITITTDGIIDAAEAVKASNYTLAPAVAGVSVVSTARAEDSNIITLTLTGTPTAASSDAITVTIKKAVVTDLAADITATGATWAIAAADPVYTMPTPVTAKLHDAAGNIADKDLVGTYTIGTVTTDATTGKITVPITATNLQKHQNADAGEGYWVGFALAAPDQEATQAKWKFAATEAELTVEQKALEANINANGDKGIALYANYNEEAPYKKFAKVQWLDKDGNVITIGGKDEFVYEMVLTVTTVNPDVKVEAAKPNVPEPDKSGMTTEERTIAEATHTAITDAVGADTKVVSETALEEAVANMDNYAEVTQTEVTDANVTALNGTSVDGATKETAVVVIQPYLDIQIKGVTANESNPTKADELVIDITPMYRVVLTTEANVANIKVEGDTGVTQASEANAVVISERPETIAVKPGEVIEVKIPVPNVFANDGEEVYVTHKNVEHKCTVTSGAVTIQNKNGFSEFTLSKTSSAVAAIGGERYMTLAEAVAAVPENGNVTITLLADIADEAITIDAAKTFTITLGGHTLADSVTFAVADANALELSKENVLADPADQTSAVTGVKVTVTEKAAPEVWTVTFNSQGGSAVASASVAKDGDGKVAKPADPTRSGYTFGGWYKEASCTTAWDFDNDTVAADTTLYAKWTQNSGGNKKPHGSSGGGGGATSSTTVTISSDDSSVKADVKISGGTATIGKVENISKVVDDGVVSIDLSGQKKDIDTVKVDSSIVNAIANSDDNEGMEIKLSDGTVTFDADAMVSLKGGDLTVKLDKTNANSLNSKQKDAVKDMDVQGYYELTLNKALKDGEVEVRIPFTAPKDKDASDMVLVRVSESGVAEEVSARFSGNEVRFTATESGDYVIVARAAQTTEPSEPATPTQPAANFSDVDAGAWYGNAVNYVVANGLMSGVGNGLFAPNTNLSRAMLAQILYNQAGRPAAGDAAFNDVASGMWYTNAIAWAAAQGVVSGYGNGMFGPNDNITREQLAVMLYRFAGSPAVEGSLSSFTDAGKVSGYAQNALIWATTNGVMSGKGGGNLDPAGLATRAEVAQMLYNYLNR